MTLLEKALASSNPPRRSRYQSADEARTREELELAVAFFRGEVTYGKAALALGFNAESSAGIHLLGVLRRAVIDGRAHVMVLR